MSLLKRANIKAKLLVPTILLLLLLVFSILLATRHFVRKSYNDNTQFIINNKEKEIYAALDALGKQAVHHATICSSISSVENAYERYYITNDFDSTAAALEKEFFLIENHLNRYSNVKSWIHFHLPPAQSLYRSWHISSFKKGENLSNFRNSIVDVSKKHKPVYGIETGRSGFAIRGITPIISSRKEFLGSVEAVFPMSELIPEIKTSEKEQFAFYMHVEEYNVATIYQKITTFSQESSRKGNYIFLDKSSDLFETSNLKESMFIDDFSTKSSFTQNNYLYTFLPLKNISGKHVGICVFQLDISQQQANLKHINLWVFFIAIFMLLLIIWIFYAMLNNLVALPVKSVSNALTMLTKGKLSENIVVTGSDEIGNMQKALNQLSHGLEETSNFAKQIGQGKLDVPYTPLSDEDVLGNSLLEMRNSLINAAEKENKRREEDQQRNWAAQGEAMFAEVLRLRTEDINELGYNILKNLIAYLKASQGGLFILNDFNPNDKHLQMVASFAFDRRKFINKKVAIGEGLVGMCFFEQKTIYKTRVPNDYLLVKSFTGSTNPKTLILVPLKQENQVLGVLEIASFNQFKDYEIEFLEKVAESVASTISLTKINQQTTELLQRSRLQSQELEHKEKEMRKNIEKLSLMQQRVAKQEIENKGFTDSVDKSAIRADIDLDGTFLDANLLFFETFSTSKSELHGKHISTVIPEKDLKEFYVNWSKVVKGEKYLNEQRLFYTGEDLIWLHASFSPVKDEKGQTQKIVMLATNTHQMVTENIYLKTLKEAINSSISIAEFSPSGELLDVEQLLKVKHHFDGDLLKNKLIFDFVDQQEDLAVRRSWNSTLSGHVEKTNIPLLDIHGHVHWYSATLIPISELNESRISKIVFVGTEISTFIESAKHSAQTDAQLKEHKQIVENQLNELLEIKALITEEKAKREEAEKAYKELRKDLVQARADLKVEIKRSQIREEEYKAELAQKEYESTMNQLLIDELKSKLTAG